MRFEGTCVNLNPKKEIFGCFGKLGDISHSSRPPAEKYQGVLRVFA